MIRLSHCTAGTLALFLCCTAKPETQSNTKDEHLGAHAHSNAEAEHSDHEALANRVTLSANVMQKAKLKFSKATHKNLAATLDLTGEVVADPDARAVVTARISARIVDVRFRENDKVTAGQVLVVLESGELARARAALTSTEAKLQAAQRQLERLESLSNKGLSSGQELELARADKATASAEAVAAKQTLMAFGHNALDASADAARLTIVAPVAGRVLSRQAVRGESVAAERVLAEIANLDSAYFQARVFEKDLAAIGSRSKAEVRLNAFADTVFVGEVESVGRQVDPNTRTVLARVRIENQNDLLKVGLFGTARIVDAVSSASQKASLVVPLSAVTDLAGKRVVFVRTADGEFEVHQVTLGRTAEGEAEVLSGLRLDEEVVYDGVFTLKSAVLKSSFGEEE